MKKKQWKRNLSAVVLSLFVIMGNCQQPAYGGFAVQELSQTESSQEEDVQAEDTGEKEHGKECYRQVKKCLHRHTEECDEDSSADSSTASQSNAEKKPLNCKHVCDEDSGCITWVLDCRHEDADENRPVTRAMERTVEEDAQVTQRTGMLTLGTTDSSNPSEGWEWSADSANQQGTLTLTDCHITADKSVIQVPHDWEVAIVLIGENVLESTSKTYYGPLLTSGLSDNYWRIEGDGKLTISTNSDRAYGFTGRTITIQSGQILANLEFCMIYNDFVVEDGAQLEIHATSMSTSNAIYSDLGPVEIRGGKLDIEAGQVGIFVPGIGNNGTQDVIISGGEININAGASCINIQSGQGSSQTLTISGGHITGTAGSVSGLYAQNIVIAQNDETPTVHVMTDAQPAIRARENLSIGGNAEVTAESAQNFGLHAAGEINVSDSAQVTATGKIDGTASSVNVEEGSVLNAMIRTDSAEGRTWTVYGNAELHSDLILGPEALETENGEKVPVKLVITPGAVLSVPEGITLDASTNITPDTLDQYLSADKETIDNLSKEEGILKLPVSMFQISLIAEPAEGGTVEGDGSFPENEQVSVKAIPAAGYHFVRWMDEGNEAGTNPVLTFTITADRSLTAVFEKDAEPTIETVQTPTITPSGGTFEKEQIISIRCATEGAEIYYTTDESIPTIGSQKYAGEFVIYENTVIKAIAVKDGMNNSQTVSVSFTKTDNGGDDNNPGSGDDNKPGSGDDNKPGSGDDNKPGSGNDNKPGSGDDNKPGSGSGNTSNSGGSGSGSKTSSSNSDRYSADSGIWENDGYGWRLRYPDGTYETGIYIKEKDSQSKEQISWKYRDGAWWAFGRNGYLKEGWVWDTASNRWYYMDTNKGMQTGWIQDAQDGQWYYLEPENGYMMTGWNWIDGSWYYMNSSTSAPSWNYNDETGSWSYDTASQHKPFGAMYRNERTPDGYMTDKDGKYIPNS